MADYNKVVLVDEQDRELGVMDKLEAHSNGGVRHRAITAVLYRQRDGAVEVLLQKRGEKKPLWPLFWDATCSTHPVLGEGYEECGVRRLKEELGVLIKSGDLKLVDKQVYRADYKGGLAECEVNGVLVAKFEGEFKVNRDEVADAAWKSWEEVKKEVVGNRDKFVPWFWMMVGEGLLEKALRLK